MSMERNNFINSKQEDFSFLEIEKDDSDLSFLFFHATGFNALTYKIFLENLFQKSTHNINIKAMDLRGHGMTQANDDPKLLESWSLYVNDTLEWIDSIEGDLVVGGHSMGAIVASRLAAARPDKVKKLIMLEPVLFSPFNSFKMRLMSKLRSERSSKLISNTSRRRYKFSSQEEVITSYLGRGAFETWSRSWIENYVLGGTKQLDGGEVILSCHPLWESKTFSTSAMDNWQHLQKVHCLSYVASGGINSTFPDGSRNALKRLGLHWNLEHFPDSSHFLPMEKSETLIDRIDEFMSK